MAVAGEQAVLEALKRCCERWGINKVSIDDVAAEAGVSRATLYRMFPGGRDVMLDSMRIREMELFFERLRDGVVACDSLEDLLITTVVLATRELRADDHLATMLAAEPGVVIDHLTVEGLPRILRVANAFLVPLADPYVDRDTARAAIDVLARLTLSYFLAPSDVVDLGDEDSARAFLRPLLETLLRHGSATNAGLPG